MRILYGNISRRVGCEVNKGIVATRPKAALCYETQSQPLFVKTKSLCAVSVGDGTDMDSV